MYCLDYRLYCQGERTTLGKLMKAWSIKSEQTDTSKPTSSDKNLVRQSGAIHGKSTNKRRSGADADAFANLPNFAHLNLDYLGTSEAKSITHTSLAGGVWKINCAKGNQSFLEEYAKAVTSDWLNRFHPVRTRKLVLALAEYKKRETIRLNPDIMDLEEQNSRDSASTLPMTSSNLFGSPSESLIELEDANSLPAWSSSDMLVTSHHGALPSHLRHSSALVRPRSANHFEPPSVCDHAPLFLSFSEIASPKCFKLFFDLDSFWACNELGDDDLALISILFQVIQASVRLFFPTMSDSEWETVGTIVGKRTELRPEIRSKIEYDGAWQEGLARIVAAQNAPSHTLAGYKRRQKLQSSLNNAAGLGRLDDTQSLASSSSRLTHASLWSSESNTSSSSSKSQVSALSDPETSESLSHIQTMVQNLVQNEESNGISQLLAQYANPPTLTSSGGSSTRPRTSAKSKPQCAGKLQDFFADSEATVAAVESQIAKKGYFVPYKLGMNAHFPNLLVTAEQAKLIREYVVVQIVTNVICRQDILQHARLLAFGKGLVKLSDNSIASTLEYWNSKVLDEKVFGTGLHGPNCRMIFSRKISRCKECADYEGAAAANNKKRNSDGVPVSRATELCSTCNGTGKADEGPDAVSHGMFAIKGNGRVVNNLIESCMDVSKNPRRTKTCLVLQNKPITVSSFFDSAKRQNLVSRQVCAAPSISISNIWTPCVRWLPKNVTNVQLLSEEWVRLTSIRVVPNITLANGDPPSEMLTKGFVVPSCWCHLFDESLTLGKSSSNDLLHQHIRSGFFADQEQAASSAMTTSTFRLQSVFVATRKELSKSNNVHQHAPDTTDQHTAAHQSLDSVLKFAKNGRTRAVESYNGVLEYTKPSLSKSRFGITSPTIRQQLQNLIIGAQPVWWSKLIFDIPIFCKNPWPLDHTLPKSQLAPHLYEHYEGAERAAIRYQGMCWTMTCSGAHVHNCLIKGSPHNSACIHFRITPTHVFQLCYSKSQCQCYKKFVIVCQVPPQLSRLLFTTI